MTKGKLKFVAANINQDIFNALKRRAILEGRSVSGQIRFFIIQGVNTAQK